MKKKIATLLRKLANRLAPSYADSVNDVLLTYDEYEIKTIKFLCIVRPEVVDYPCYKEDMAGKIGLKMLEMGAIAFQYTHHADGKLETLATAYVGIKK